MGIALDRLDDALVSVPKLVSAGTAVPQSAQNAFPAGISPEQFVQRDITTEGIETGYHKTSKNDPPVERSGGFNGKCRREHLRRIVLDGQSPKTRLAEVVTERLIVVDPARVC